MHTRMTPSAKKSDKAAEWLHIDADGKVLGRLASQIATVLMGKHRPSYTPHADTGDFVIVTNCEKVLLTGRRPLKKMYYRHSGYKGGIKETSFAELIEQNPEEVIRRAVRLMLPKNRLGRKQLAKLKIYAGPEHPHAAQQPREWKPLHAA